MKYKVVGLGELLWDILPSGKQLGGAPANFAFHCRELGANGYVVSAISNDDLGNELLATISDLSLVDTYIQIDETHPTGTVDVRLDSSGQPTYIIHKDVAWDFIRFSEDLRDLASTSDAVCFGTLAQRSSVTRETIQRFIRATPKNCLRVFDVNLRQNYFTPDIIQENLYLANCLKLNDEELPVILELLSWSGSVETLLEKYELKMLALTKGSEGSVLYTPREKSVLRTPVVKIADTIGAGDAFNATLTYGLLEDRPLHDIHVDSTNLAAAVCMHSGATPSHKDFVKIK